MGILRMEKIFEKKKFVKKYLFQLLTIHTTEGLRYVFTCKFFSKSKIFFK